MKRAQEQKTPNRESSQKIVLSSLQGLPSLTVPKGTRQQHNPLSMILHDTSGDSDEDLLHQTKSMKHKTLDEKFNHALSALLNSEDSDSSPDKKVADASTHSADPLEGASTPVKWPPLDTQNKCDPRIIADFTSNSEGILILATDEPVDKSSGDNSKNISAEIPDYSADFNSESERIDQEEKFKDSNEDGVR